jgi:hypothetical protein
MGITMNEEVAPLVYTYCLTKVIGSGGIEIPAGILPRDKDTERLIYEVFK